MKMQDLITQNKGLSKEEIITNIKELGVFITLIEVDDLDEYEAWWSHRMSMMEDRVEEEDLVLKDFNDIKKFVETELWLVEEDFKDNDTEEALKRYLLEVRSIWDIYEDNGIRTAQVIVDEFMQGNYDINEEIAEEYPEIKEHIIQNYLYDEMRQEIKECLFPKSDPENTHLYL